MKKIVILLSLLFFVSTCKKDEETTVLVNASVANSSEGSVDFKSGDYSIGSSVTFSATPKTGYQFVNWTDASTNQTYSTNPLNLTVNDNTNLIANFEKISYNINLSITGQGEVLKEVVGGGTEFTHGSTIELTAVPADDFSFFYWNNTPGDIENPKRITLENNQEVAAKFDYETARELVGEWEFELQDGVAAKSHGRVLMRIDIRLNILFTFILNNQTTQIFSRLTTLNSTTMVMGGFGAFTNVSFKTTSSSYLSFNLIIFPPKTSQPSSLNNIPPPTPSNSLTLSGNKTSNNTAPIVPPASATTSSTVVPSQTASSTNPLAGVVSQVNATVNPIACTISGTLTSGPQTQTVTATSAITNVVFTFSTTCTDTLTANATGLPSGVSMSFSNNIATISGTPSANATGTFNYSLTAVNAAATASSTFDGSLVVNPLPVTVSSTTTSTSIYFENGTCKCPDASVGDTATISGTLYTVVDDSTIAGEIANGNVNLCTTLVTDMSGKVNDNFFKSTTFNQDISSWDTSNVTTMEHMFRDASLFNQDISGWDVSNVTSFYRMFAYTSAFNQPIGSWNMSSATTISGMFRGSNEQNRTVFDQDISSWDTSNVVVMSEVFAYSDFNQNIGSWDVSSVRLLTAMFTYNPNFNQDIGGWDLSSMTDANNLINGQNYGDAENRMNGVFRNATSFNQDLSAWCVTDVTTEPEFFSDNSALTDANKPVWGKEFTIALTSGSLAQTVTATIAITPIQYTVSSNCTTTLSISASNLPSGVSAALSNNVATISGTPAGTATGTFNYSLTVSGSTTGQTVTGTIIVNSPPPNISFDSSGICKCPDASVGDTATISGTLYTVVDDSTIAGEIANGNVNLCTTLVTDMSGKVNDNFFKSTTFNQDISSWDTSNVTTMEHMFRDASLFNQDISGWDVSNVTSFYRMFAYTSAFNQPIGSWNMSSATTISGMFRGSNEQNRTVFDQDISSWDTSNVVVMSEVFAYSDFNQNIGSWDVSSVRLLTAMFTYNPNFNQDIGGWDLSSMTDANNLINGQNYGDAENRMNGVFRNATSFNQDLSAWCVTDVTTEPEFFSDNSALTDANKPVWGYCPSSYTLNVTASSSSDYTLSGSDRTGNISGSDPNLTFSIGETISFAVDASGHPFYLKTVQGTGTSNLITGVTNNGATNGTVSWTPTAAGTYYYQCSLHNGMNGTITVQ